MKLNNLLLTTYFFCCCFTCIDELQAQVGMNTSAPLASAVLDLESTNKGFLPPRMTVEQMNAIDSPATGLVVYCTNCEPRPGPYHFNGTDFVHFSNASQSSSLSSLDCSAPTNTGTLYALYPSLNTSSQVSFTVSEGGIFSGVSIPSTGVLGLQAVVFSRNLPTASTGNLDVYITGTPSSVGTATFPFSFGGRDCSIERTVLTAPVVGSLNCAAATDATRVRLWSGYDRTLDVNIPYTAGNGEPYPLTGRDTFPSRGVTGLTATILPGTLANGSGTIQVRITGTPSGAGNAVFDLDFGLQNCTLVRAVSNPQIIFGIPVQRILYGSSVHNTDGDINAVLAANGAVYGDLVSATKLISIMTNGSSVRSFNTLSYAVGFSPATNYSSDADHVFGYNALYYRNGGNGRFASLNFSNGGSDFTTTSSTRYYVIFLEY